MSTTITVPEGFQYVGGALLSTVFVLIGQVIVVGKWRKRAGVQYPQLYAETAVAAKDINAKTFNCAQRAHQNTLENVYIVALTTILTGLKYPHFAAAACGYWAFSRIPYTRGYISGDPNKRNSPLSSLGTLSALGLILTSTYITGKAIIDGLRPAPPAVWI